MITSDLVKGKKKMAKALVYFVSIISFGLVLADGKIVVRTDIKDAYIYIDGKKKAMVGDGATTISVKEGEHKVKVNKTTDNWRFSGERDVFVGNGSTIEIEIKTSKRNKDIPSNVTITTLKKVSMESSIFSVKDEGVIKFKFGKFSSWKELQDFAKRNPEKAKKDLPLFLSSLRGQMDLKSDLKFEINDSNDWDGKTAPKVNISITSEKKGGAILPLGSMSWSELIALKKPTKKSSFISEIKKIEEKEGLAFWLITRSNEYILVKVGTVLKAKNTYDKGASVELQWLKVD